MIGLILRLCRAGLGCRNILSLKDMGRDKGPLKSNRVHVGLELNGRLLLPETCLWERNAL